MSQREAALAAFFTAISGIAGATTERNRDVPPDIDDMPFLIQFDGGHEVRPGVTEQDDYTMTVDVEIYVTATTPAELGAALNTLWAEIVKAALADVTLGGAAQDVRERSLTDPELLQDDNDSPVMRAALTFEVLFATAEGDPFNAP